MKTLLYFLLALFFFYGCRQPEVAPVRDPLVATAQHYFETEILPRTGVVDGRIARHLLPKEAEFGQAVTRQIDGRPAVVVPVAYDRDLSIRPEGGGAGLSLSEMTRLVWYEDAQGEGHAEVVLSIPDEDFLRAGSAGDFTGTIIVEDWLGNFIKGYRLFKDGSYRDITSTGSMVKGGTEEGSAFRAPADNCGTTDWYSCAVVGDQGHCTYMYSEPNNCSGSGGSIGTGSNGGGGGPRGGTISPGGYGHVASGGGSSRPTTPTVPASAKSICEKSFQYKKVIELDAGGKGGWQIAAVRNIHMNLVDTRNGVTQVIRPGTTIYFGLPVIRTNGDFYSTAYAAFLTKEAVQFAEAAVLNEYHKYPQRGLDVAGMSKLYRDKLNYFMSLIGGSATLTPGANISVTPTEARYGGILGLGCL